MVFHQTLSQINLLTSFSFHPHKYQFHYLCTILPENSRSFNLKLIYFHMLRGQFRDYLFPPIHSPLCRFCDGQSVKMSSVKAEEHTGYSRRQILQR